MPRKKVAPPAEKLPNPTLVPGWFLVFMVVAVFPGVLAEWLGFLAFVASLLASGGSSF